MTTKEFMEKVFDKFQKEDNMTDRIFCFIESDRELLNMYLDLLSESQQQLKVVNSTIAKCIRDHYNLKNTGISNGQPKSKLIQSYHELE
jgi:rubrerythrin